MTVKLSFDVPDDNDASFQGHGNASAAARRVLTQARRARQREAAQAFGEHMRRRPAQQAEDDRLMIEHSNDIALRDSQC